MKKIEKNGKVAVLYSPDHGGGWSTWAEEDAQKAALCMDARIVGAFLENGKNGAIAAALEIFPNIYLWSASSLKVAWIEKGANFEIEEYDGSESVHVIGSRNYFVA